MENNERNEDAIAVLRLFPQLNTLLGYIETKASFNGYDMHKADNGNHVQVATLGLVSHHPPKMNLILGHEDFAKHVFGNMPDKYAEKITRLWKNLTEDEEQVSLEECLPTIQDWLESSKRKHVASANNVYMVYGGFFAYMAAYLSLVDAGVIYWDENKEQRTTVNPKLLTLEVFRHQVEVLKEMKISGALLIKSKELLAEEEKRMFTVAYQESMGDNNDERTTS